MGRMIFKGSILFYFLTVTFGFSTKAQVQKPGFQTSKPGEVKWLSEVFPGYEKLSIDWLQNLIREKQVSSIEELLPLLPESLRSNYTLMRDTNSLQDSSDLNPRAILFAPDARLVMAFNGAPYQKRFNKLEILDYTAKNKAARFFEIDFAKSGEDRFSEPNQAVCMQCHATHPRPNGEVKPIWPRYSQWKGAYGEKDDHIKGDEAESYQKFTQAALKHPRYKWLIRDSKRSETAPYYGSKNQRDGNDRPLFQGGTYEDSGIQVRFRNLMFMPNLRLSKTLDARNAARIAYKIMQKDLFKDFPYTTLFSLACEKKGRNIPVFISEDFGIDSNQFSILFSDWISDYSNGNQKFSTEAMVSGVLFKEIIEHHPTMKRYYKPSYWNNSYSEFELGPKADGDSQTETYKYLWSWSYLMDEVTIGFSKDSLFNFRREEVGIEANSGSAFDHFCSDLGQLVSDEVSGREAEISFAYDRERKFVGSVYGKSSLQRPKRDVNQILNQCSGCHDNSDLLQTFAPAIPFSDAEKLAEFLSSQQTGDHNPFIAQVEHYTSGEQVPAHRGGKRMPLGMQPLGEAEVESLIGYMKGLLSDEPK